MGTDISHGGARWKRLALFALGTAIAALYLITLLSPLRLNTDSISYLTMALNARDGLGFVFNSGEIRFNHYPWGYPAIVAAVDAMGLASAAALTVVNIVGLVLAAWTAWLLGRRVFGLGERPALLCVLLALLSFVFMRQIARPVPEALFAGVFSLSLYYFYRSTNEHSLKLWLLALVLAGLATSFRLAAVTLVPTAFWALLFALPAGVSRTLRERPLISGAVMLVPALVVAALATQSGYFHEWLWVFRRDGILETVWWNVQSKLMEWGEISTNTPLGTVPGWAYPLMALAGATGIAALCFSLLRQGRKAHVLWVGVLCYAGLMFAWPGRDPRFWINFIPLAACCVVWLYGQFWQARAVRFIAGAHLTLYVALGIGALLFSAGLSVSREFFMAHYTKGYVLDAYEAYYTGADEATLDEDTRRELRVLKRFPPLLKPDAGGGMAE